MKNQDMTNRRTFVACCVCAGCAGMAVAAKPSSRNVKSLKPAGGDEPALTPLTGNQQSNNYDIAFCGIYCGACEGKLNGIGKTGKKCKCCTNPSMKSNCAIFNCAKDKKVVNCGLCPDFDDCDKLKKHHEKPLYRQVARTTCKKIKADGMDAADAELKKRWSCPSCEKIFSWKTEEKCPHCKKPIQPLSNKDV